MFDFLKNMLRPSNEGEIKKVRKIVDQINALESEVKKLSDDQMREKIAALKGRAQGGESLDALLPETYALVREAGVRVLNQRAFDVQLIGAIVLHQGRIAEMRTGEGKTLTATFPAVLNALTGKGVHVVTVNDYLAKFQSEWMGKIYRFLGLSVGLIVHDLDAAQRQAAYGADVIARISACQQGKLDQLQGLMVRRLQADAAELCRQGGIDPDQADFAVLAGNTVMCHLVWGLDPASIGRAPYTPLSLFGDTAPAGELLPCPVWTAPCLAGYVGGDILAGMITYSTDKRMAANLETITAQRAKDIIEMNRRGEKPESLQHESKTKEQKGPVDLLAGDSITRFDKAKKKKKKKKKPQEQPTKDEQKGA